jgi:hypothetical protein
MTHIVELRTSRDGGRNWSDWRAYDMGNTGQFDGRATWRRLGFGRTLLFQFRDTSPYRGDVIAASIDAE